MLSALPDELLHKRLVELDIGIGILPHWAIKNEVASGTLVSLPIGRKKLVRHWIVAHAATRDLSFAESLLKLAEARPKLCEAVWSCQSSAEAAEALPKLC